MKGDTVSVRHRLYKAIIERESVHDGGILLAVFNKLTVRDLRILVLVHILEYLVHPLFRCFLVLRKLQHLASHLVDGLDYLKHFLVGYVAILIDVVQLKSPSKLLFGGASASSTKGAYELFEIDVTILVLIKDVEDVVGKFAGVAEGEEL